MTRKTVSYLTELQRDVFESQMNISELSDIIDQTTHELISLTPENVRTEQNLVNEHVTTLERAQKELCRQLEVFKQAATLLREFF